MLNAFSPSSSSSQPLSRHINYPSNQIILNKCKISLAMSEMVKDCCTCHLDPTHLFLANGICQEKGRNIMSDLIDPVMALEWQHLGIQRSQLYYDPILICELYKKHLLYYCCHLT